MQYFVLSFTLHAWETFDFCFGEVSVEHEKDGFKIHSVSTQGKTRALENPQNVSLRKTSL